MRLGRGVNPVDGLATDPDGGVEAERTVRGHEVVVDGLGHPDDPELVPKLAGAQHQPMTDVLGPVATDDNEPLDTASSSVREDPLGHVPCERHTVDRALEFEGVVAVRGAEDRPSAREDPRDVDRSKRLEAVSDETPKAVPDADELDVAPLELARTDDRTNHGVETGAVAASCEDPEPTLLAHLRSRGEQPRPWPSTDRSVGSQAPEKCMPRTFRSAMFALALTAVGGLIAGCPTTGDDDDLED